MMRMHDTGASMITCMNCEHGHHCPYTGEADDLLHALLFIWDDMPKSKGSFDSFARRFEAKDASAFKEITEIVRNTYGIEIDFEFGYDGYSGPPVGIKRCEKFEEVTDASTEDDVIVITEDDVKAPLGELTINNKAGVRILDMEDYLDVFFSIERTVMEYWESHPNITDRDVQSTFDSLLRNFDNQKEDTLASEISKGVKAMLILGRRTGNEDYTIGEIFSCIRFLKGIAKNHKSPDGIGYLKWTRAFFEGRMPETPEEIAKYIFEEET
ncbi:MAG: hypothetical protein Q7J68_00215 [Thermoplasmata archaeon]|nr:hypothetical protein [Thermoplasmata archaeon]